MDLIAQMLTNIRNAQAVKHESVKTPYSKVNLGIAEIFKREGWIKEVTVKSRGEKKSLVIELKYEGGNPAFSGLRRVSKHGQRIYIKYGEIPRVRHGYGLAIISTPKGILSGEDAKKEKVGGEFLCEIY